MSDAKEKYMALQEKVFNFCMKKRDADAPMAYGFLHVSETGSNGENGVDVVYGIRSDMAAELADLCRAVGEAEDSMRADGGCGLRGLELPDMFPIAAFENLSEPAKQTVWKDGGDSYECSPVFVDDNVFDAFRNDEESSPYRSDVFSMRIRNTGVRIPLFGHFSDALFEFEIYREDLEAIAAGPTPSAEPGMGK